MTATERLDVLKATRKALGPDGFVFGNASACCLDDAIELATMQATDACLPDALLLLPPFYHAPFSQRLGHDGVEAFFVAFLSRYAELSAAIDDCRPYSSIRSSCTPSSRSASRRTRGSPSASRQSSAASKRAA